MTTTHQQVKSWIAAMWKYGAIDVSSRDELTHMLDVEHRDYHLIVAEMRPSARYLPAKSFARWQTWQAAFGGTRTQPEPCPGLEYPCGASATCEYRTRTGNDMETARAVSLWYCPAHYADLTETANATH